MSLYSRIWVYDGNRLKKESAAASLSDIFNPQKFPGKRGLKKEIRTAAEWALMADGVPNDQVYRVLGTPDGFKRALNKLEAIKRDIVWYTVNQQGAQLLVDGEISYLMIPSNRFVDIVTKDKKNIIPIWQRQVYTFDTWVIPRGAPNAALAIQFIKYASDPRRMADFAMLTSMAPVRKSADAYLRRELTQYLATTYFEGALNTDDRFWADNLDAYSRQFEAWLQR
jgi:putative spermidine/putrescine transport system substrate-binding protein